MRRLPWLTLTAAFVALSGSVVLFWINNPLCSILAGIFLLFVGFILGLRLPDRTNESAMPEIRIRDIKDFDFGNANLNYRVENRERPATSSIEIKDLDAILSRKTGSPATSSFELKDLDSIKLGKARSTDIPITETVGPNCVIRKVFYATDRQPRVDEGTMPGFDGERNEDGRLSFGVCTVTIPADHKIGSLETPTILKLQFSYNPGM